MSKRYSWTAQGSQWPMLNIIDWQATGGPRVVACVPQTEDDPLFRQFAAEAAIRLLMVTR